jgi:acyl-CoA synthetase (NDP forming)
MSRLKAALDPKSVAIIGASENPNKVGGRPVHYLDKFGFGGKIFPINPSRTEVQGYKCYNSLGDLPEAPEMVIVAVAGDNAIGVVEDCAAHGVKIAVVMASGFGEVDAVAGKAKERRMVEAAQKPACVSSARIRKGWPISAPARLRVFPPCSWTWTGPRDTSRC